MLVTHNVVVQETEGLPGTSPPVSDPVALGKLLWPKIKKSAGLVVMRVVLKRKRAFGIYER